MFYCHMLMPGLKYLLFHLEKYLHAKLPHAMDEVRKTRCGASIYIYIYTSCAFTR